MQDSQATCINPHPHTHQESVAHSLEHLLRNDYVSKLIFLPGHKMCCVTVWYCYFGFKCIKKRQSDCTNSLLSLWIHPTQCHLLRSQCQAPNIHVRRQITRTTAETMESSWFYWLGLSCQRYWVFIYSNSQLVCDQTSSDINLLKHLWTQGDMGKKQQAHSLLRTMAKKPMHPSSEAKPTWHVCNTEFPGFLKKTSVLPWRFPSESRKWRAEDWESRLEEEGLARGDNPRNRYFPRTVQEHILYRVHNIKNG